MPPIVKKDLKLPDGQKALAFVLRNVCTKQECDEYIKKTEEMGYERALLGEKQTLRTNIRNSYRCIWDSAEEGQKLWERIRTYIPVDHIPGWQPVGLNERLRFLRYDPAEFFIPHFDAFYERKDGERSFVSLHLDLNEGFLGGNTTFLSMHDDNSQFAVVPKTGNVLLFPHRVLHEDSIMTHGRRYLMRTDIMFERLPDNVYTNLPPDHVYTKSSPDDVPTQSSPDDASTQSSPDDVSTQSSTDYVYTKLRVDPVYINSPPDHVYTTLLQDNDYDNLPPNHVSTKLRLDHIYANLLPDDV